MAWSGVATSTTSTRSWVRHARSWPGSFPTWVPSPTARNSGLGIGSAQGRLFELVLGVLERLAQRAPVVLVAEDLHWSDQSTRDLLGFLVRNLRDVPVALVLTYRSDELASAPPTSAVPCRARAEPGSSSGSSSQPFDLGDAAAQLRAIAGDDLDPRLIESIHARSGGNAFFAEELLLRPARTPSIATCRRPCVTSCWRGSRASRSRPRSSCASHRPPVSASTRLLLAAAASLDRRGALRRPARVRRPPGPRARSERPAERYAFRHALLQEAVYDDLLPGERTRAPLGVRPDARGSSPVATPSTPQNSLPLVRGP